MVKVSSWLCPRSAPLPPQGAPGCSGQLGTLRVRPAHWAPSHCLGCSSEPLPKLPTSPPLTLTIQEDGSCPYCSATLLASLPTRRATLHELHEPTTNCLRRGLGLGSDESQHSPQPFPPTFTLHPLASTRQAARCAYNTLPLHCRYITATGDALRVQHLRAAVLLSGQSVD